MVSRGVPSGRRAVLGLGAGALLALGAPTSAVASPEREESAGTTASTAEPHGSKASRRLRALEHGHKARLRVFGRNMVTGASVSYHAHERSPICSVWKPLAAAAVLRDFDRDGEFLAKRVRYNTADLVEYSPITGKDKNLADGMTVSELCHAAICYSDNSAANFLLREIGGPHAITRFCRSVGDRRTRLDRWETELNSAEPWRVEDTTDAFSIARTFSRLTLGNSLQRQDRKQLTDWMLNNTTSEEQFRAGLPQDWTIADKTGAGSYGTDNNVGVAWTPDRTPIVLAVLSTKRDADAEADNPLIAKTAAVLAEALT